MRSFLLFGTLAMVAACSDQSNQQQYTGSMQDYAQNNAAPAAEPAAVATPAATDTSAAEPETAQVTTDAAAASPEESVPTAPATTSTIPVEYYGVWGVPGDAGCEDDSDSRMQVHAQKLTFWESEGVVSGVTSATNGGIDVTVDMSGEGDTWSAKYNLRLSGASLLVSEDGASPLDRTRCP